MSVDISTMDPDDLEELLDGMEMVREGGRVNMMDRYGVQAEADRLGLYALVVFCEDARRGSAWVDLLHALEERLSA